MRKISGDTGSDWIDIEASDVGDGVVALEEKSEWLSDSTGGAENSNVLVDLGGGREGSCGGSGEHSERSKVVTPWLTRGKLMGVMNDLKDDPALDRVE